MTLPGRSKALKILITYKTQPFCFVIPAEAGIQSTEAKLDPRLRGDDILNCF